MAAMPLAAFPKCYLDAMLRDRSMSVRDWIAIASDLPLDGVELYWPTVVELSDDALRELRVDADRRGLQLPLMCASPDFTQPDRVAFEREIAEQARAIRATAILGGSVTRVLSGQRRPGLSRALGIALTVSAITRLLPVAREHGIVLAIENHLKDYFWVETEFAQNSDVFLEIVGGIPEQEPFGVQFDASNTFVIGEDPYALLEAVKGRVVSAAASDRDAVPDAAAPFGRRVTHHPVGEGSLDYDRIFGTLAEAGFRGWVSIEDGDDPQQGPRDLLQSALFTRAAMRRHGLD
jgi:sugar phosphate isomerase/epimerase